MAWASISAIRSFQVWLGKPSWARSSLVRSLEINLGGCCFEKSRRLSRREDGEMQSCYHSKIVPMASETFCVGVMKAPKLKGAFHFFRLFLEVSSSELESKDLQTPRDLIFLCAPTTASTEAMPLMEKRINLAKPKPSIVGDTRRRCLRKLGNVELPDVSSVLHRFCIASL